ncbi:unnamed protein product [Merluccius merluccius]
MLSHVEHYDVMRPQRLHTREKRSIAADQLYPDVLGYEWTLDGRNHTIHLQKNSNLLSKNYTETHYLEDGSRVTTPGSQDHCYYHGHVEGVLQSSVSVDVCRGIKGFIRARQQVYFIEPLGDSDDGDHAVYRPEHLKVSSSSSSSSSSTSRSSLGSRSSSNSSEDYELDQDLGPKLSNLFKSRSWKTDQTPSSQRFVELIVVVDNTEYIRFGSQTRPRILGAVNHIDKLYQSLGIRVVLVGLEIWSYRNYISMDPNSETTLDQFLLWRQTDLLKRKPHDNAQFVTGIDFEGDTVGLANKFAMCTGNSGGVNQDHHDNLIGLASTIAHEMGHNFGLSHDTPECKCRSSLLSGTCVMADKLRKGSLAFPEFFSSCSEQQLAEFLERAQPNCLSKPANTIDPRCGNAILDPGEDCDCGIAAECRNPCCDASTCRLAAGSQCAHGECCNDSCQLKGMASVCRSSAGECDLSEYCTGLSENCPEDSFVMNGKPCYNQGQGYCYNGQCPTNKHHCWRLFGPAATVGSDTCFDLNRKGQDEAHCGRNRYDKYIPCTAANVKCGSIFCEGSGDSITGKKAVFSMPGRAQCLVVVDDERTRSLDMVPTGSRCGDNKVCSNNRCADTTLVYGLQDDCSGKCNNKGVCNHKKQCHCDPGWAPPYCDIQFADLPQDQSVVIAGVCSALAILLVLIAVVVGVMCCKKDRKENYPSKRKVHYTPGKLNHMFQEQVSNGKLQISQPTFVETSATHACTPLFVTAMPSRPAPQPPAAPFSQAESFFVPSSQVRSTASPSSQAQPFSGQVQSTASPSSQAQSIPVPAVKPSNPSPVPPVKPSFCKT